MRGIPTKAGQRLWRFAGRCSIGLALATLSWATLSGSSSFLSTEVKASEESVAGIHIQVDQQDLRVRYGVYQETEISLSDGNLGPVPGLVSWEVVDAELPAGLEMEETTGSTALIFGTPEFTGKWCFVLSGASEAGQKASRQICFAADDNDELIYPRFNSDRYLDSAISGRFYQEEIEVDPDSVAARDPDTGDIGEPRADAYVGELSSGQLPEGLRIENRAGSYKFLVSGRTAELGTYQFVLRLEDRYGVSSYRQFLLPVLEQDEDNSYKCPPGYYFDVSLGYCVQDKLDTCPAGTHYDPYSNSCIQYPVPPPTVVCAPGYYYDHYLGECVLIGYPRCPHNYVWDPYYDRCVRRPYTCPIGYTYSWTLKECVPIYNRCPYGYHYDPYYDRCVKNNSYCRWGYYWDPIAERCRPTSRRCEWDEHWDPQQRRCVKNRPYCGPGWVYDPQTGGCVRPPNDHRRCPPGYHCRMD